MGFITSLHCAGMCGPIACSVSSLSRGEADRMVTMTLYHVSRLLSYSIIGFLFGMVGQKPLQLFFHSPAVILPWFIVVILLFHAFGWKVKIPKPLLLMRLTMRVRSKFSKMGAYASAAAAGFFTPLLPCTPLYLVFGAAALSASPMRGLEFALAFGMGTVPLLWLVSHQYQNLARKMMQNPRVLPLMKRTLSFATALIMAWRLHDTMPVFSSPPKAEKELPSCCNHE